MKVFKNSIKWVQNNKLEVFVVLFILIFALGLRLYRIDEYMTFLGDEGRDMLVMQKIWVEQDLPFIGPPTSVGNMHLGPLYYYMMAIPTGIFWMNPVAASVMVAFIGALTVGFIYYLGRIWFGRVAGTIAAVLYALSPVAIVYARSSWNPNPAPFFSLLALYGLYKVHRSGNMNWLVITGVGLAFAINMHYLALILIPIMGLLWIYELVLHYRGKLKRANVWIGTFWAILSFLLLMSPLFVFDIKHNYPNYNALMTLFNSDESSVGGGFFENLMKIFPIYTDKLVGRYIAGMEYGLKWIVSLLILAPLIWVGIAKLMGSRLRWPYLGLGVFLIFGLLGLTFYKNEIYDHYIGFLTPAAFILFGAFGGLLWNLKSKSLKYGLSGLFGVVIILILISMVSLSPLKSSPNRQLQRTQVIAQEVLNNTGGKPYNFALIAKSNYDAAYQFYLEQYGGKPGQLPFEKTEQLFVVCEDEECRPINHPKFEIAAFGMSKIEWEKDFEGIKLFKLVPNIPETQ